MADARIVVIVPALNEAGSITSLIERVPFGPRSVIVADNGSTDGTADLARQAGARVAHAPRRGYGQACLAGLAADPGADIVVFIDADLSEDPKEMPRLVDPILNNEADFVLGTRSGGSRPWHARIGTTMCVALINRLWGTRYADLGPFRAVRGSALRAQGMQDETWSWTIEMQVKAAELGLRTIEVPVSSGPRAAGRSKISARWWGAREPPGGCSRSSPACGSRAGRATSCRGPSCRPRQRVRRGLPDCPWRHRSGIPADNRSSCFPSSSP